MHKTYQKYDLQKLIWLADAYGRNDPGNYRKYVDLNQTVSPEVLEYLKIFNPIAATGTIYEHPFTSVKQVGRVFTTAGVYLWDMRMHEYVKEFHVTLPQAFIDHIHSDERQVFIKKCKKISSFTQANQYYKDTGLPCILVDE